jgi:3-deoxy-D-manno-octulosonic-acid transferase
MFIYNLLRNLILIIFFPYFFIKREFFIKRVFSYRNIEKSTKESYIWINISSVGEVNASEPLISKLLELRKENILITIMTDTGMNIAETKFSKEKRVKTIYFPLDFKFAIKRILKIVDIKLLILIETEIWPNLINLVAENVKIVVVNGRISDNSFGKYMKIKFFLKKVLKKISFFMMQSNIDVMRIIELGADKENVKNTGNIKFDIKFEEITDKDIKDIKEKFNIGDKKVIVAGSTHDGEESLMLEIHKELRNSFLFIVPRHIKRCSEIEKKYLFEDEYVLYSKGENIKKSSIVLVNEMGILRKLYALSDIAFVGGTFVNVGGHSLLEPLYYGKMPIFGENVQNVKDISKIILENKIGWKAYNKAEFISGISYINKNQNMNREKISNFFKENSKVLDKCVKNIVDII